MVLCGCVLYTKGRNDSVLMCVNCAQKTKKEKKAAGGDYPAVSFVQRTQDTATELDV